MAAKGEETNFYCFLVRRVFQGVIHALVTLILQRTIDISIEAVETPFSYQLLSLWPHKKDAEIKAARRRMSTLNDKSGDIGDDIGGLSLDNKNDKLEVSNVMRLFTKQIEQNFLLLCTCGNSVVAIANSYFNSTL